MTITKLFSERFVVHNTVRLPAIRRHFATACLRLKIFHSKASNLPSSNGNSLGSSLYLGKIHLSFLRWDSAPYRTIANFSNGCEILPRTAAHQIFPKKRSTQSKSQTYKKKSCTKVSFADLKGNLHMQ